MRKIYLMGTLLSSGLAFAQPVGSPPANNTNAQAAAAWYRGGNNPVGSAGTNNIFGTMWNSEIYTYTAGIPRAIWTKGSALTSISGNSGDGLRILNPLGALGTAGNLDLFTSSNNGGNETHIVWGANGQISGQDNRFEQYAHGNGFRFNTTAPSGIYLFSRNAIETGRIGTNDFWLIGPRPAGNEGYNPILDAKRRLEICDDPIQFRISYKTDYSTSYTDFRNRNTGNLNILPSNNTVTANDGKVLINLDAEPSHTLDINGNERIRLVTIDPQPDALFVGNRMGNPDDLEVRRKDFPLDGNVYLDGNGNWTTPIGDGKNSLINSTPVSPGSNCPNGGFLIQSGLDINGDNTLQVNEVSNSEYICNGTNGIDGVNGVNGANGLNALTRTFPIAVGSVACPNGGFRFWAGTDLNNDGILQANEQTSNRVICNGTNGTNGNNGVNMLTNNTTLAPGDGGCANGGIFLQFGLDANSDGVLDAGEINPTLNQTICNGTNGAPGPMGPQGPAGSVVTADNGLTMSTPTNVQLGGILIRHTAVNQAGYNMHFLNPGEFGVGGIDGNSKVNIKNTTDALGNAYTNIFRLKDVANNIKHVVNENGTHLSTATKTGNSSHTSFQHITEINDFTAGTQNYNVTGISSSFLPNDGIDNSTYLGFYTSLYNKKGNTTGLEISIENIMNPSIGTNCGNKVTVKDGAQNIGTSYDVRRGTNNIGINSFVSGDGDIYGGKFLTYGDQVATTNTVYGIYSGVSYPANATAYAGYFVGDLHVSGQVSSTNGTIISSDQIFKTNINSIPNALEKINALQPHTYNYDTVNFADFNFESDQQMGLIAQEVEQVLPTLVSSHKRPAQRDSLGNITAPEITYKGVEYEEIIPLLVAGMKEQQTQLASKDSVINNLNERLTQLENCLSALLPTLCSMNQEAIQRNNDEQQKQYEKALDKTGNSQTENSELRSALEVRLSDKNAIILSQNVPNPFAEMTTIKYSIPTTVKEAQIHFYTNKGIIINSVDIVERGNGEIRVFAEDLSSGLYTYSLVADGKVVATKKMVKN